METFELRYFLAVAQHENIHRASERTRISPASLSKTIARLEDELSVKLFFREGRGIRLTDHGKLLQIKASEIIHLEEAAKMEIAGHRGSLRVILSGPEILLSMKGVSLCQSLKLKHPAFQFEFHSTGDEDALDQVIRGEAHLALVTSDVRSKKGLSAKIVAETHFQTCVGKGHPLFSAAKAKRAISIQELLKHPFVSPSDPILGKVGHHQSLDGWRDDQFPRKVEFLTSSLKLLEELVTSGRALAYLPDYYCEKLRIEMVKVSGCPYSCVQKIKLVARNPKNIGWIHQLF